MSQIQFILEYSGNDPEGARKVYNGLMDDWRKAIKQANDAPEHYTPTWIKIAAGHFEAAQILSDVFKLHHPESIGGDGSDGRILALAPPSHWAPFETTDIKNRSLYEHLCKHYKWAVPSHLQSSSRFSFL